MEQFVIWTRFTTHTGFIVRHVYGPYETRSKAQSALKRMLRNDEEYYGGYVGNLETQVTKLIGEEKS